MLPEKPSIRLIAACATTAAIVMAVAVYFGGTGRTPLAMAGTVIFVMLGGITFELARRRSA